MTLDPTVLQTIQADITAEADTRSQKDRLATARFNLAFYSHGCDARKLRPDSNLDDRQAQRVSWLMRQVVQIKTRDLYKKSPGRIVPDQDYATEWLEDVYKANAMWAKFPEAERLSLVTDVAWFQVAATGDPLDPIRINLYGSDQVAAWSTPEDPTCPAAVCLISDVPYMDNVKRKYDLWTSDAIFHYESTSALNVARGNIGPPKFVGSEQNPYGCIPFSSVHDEYPTTGLWTSGPGTYLAQVNKYVNWRLTEIANLIRSNPPMKVVKNADASFNPPTPFRPQDFLQIPGMLATKDGEFKYEQANLSFIAAEWEDLSQYIEHTLECVGVPPAAYRQVQTSVKSGAALMAEQISLIEAAKGRQMPFAGYEEQLAELCLKVAVAYYGDSQLAAALTDFSLTVKWADLWPDMPGPERDRADQWDLDNDLLSLIMLLMKRDNMTREEAEAHLEQVAEDQDKQIEILGEEPVPLMVAPGDGMSPGDLPAPQEGDEPAQEANETEPTED